MTAPKEPTNPSNLFTPYLPATYNIPEEDDRQRVFLNDKLSAISDVVNDKKIGAYTESTESFNGEKWSYFSTKKVRNGYQSISFIKNLPNSGVVTIPNPVSVNPQWVITHTWGSASKPCSATLAGDGDYFSFFNKGNPDITYVLTDTTITITTTIDLSLYSAFIVIEYLRDGSV